MISLKLISLRELAQSLINVPTKCEAKVIAESAAEFACHVMRKKSETGKPRIEAVYKEQIDIQLDED